MYEVWHPQLIQLSVQGNLYTYKLIWCISRKLFSCISAGTIFKFELKYIILPHEIGQ